MTSVGDFVPVGTLLQRQQTGPIPPAPRRALPAPSPADNAALLSARSKAWQPSAELRQAEERINAMFGKPKNGSAASTPETSPNGDER
jgi:hypothetical protein